MKRVVRIVITLMLLVPATSGGSDADYPPDPLQYLQGYYATIVRTQITKLPLTFDPSLTEGPVQSAGQGLGIAAGISFTDFVIPDHVPISDYLALDLELSTASFSDTRIANRKALFYEIILEYGLIPIRNLPLVVYGCFGGGGIHQSDYNADWLAGGDLEYLDENEYPFMTGYGLKLRLLKNVILKYDIKSGKRKWQELGDPVPGEPGWYYIEGTNYELIFKQVTLGLTYIWNSGK